MAITFLTRNIYERLRQGIGRGLLLPVIFRSLIDERLHFEREALTGHANELQVRAELFRDTDDWFEMAGLQLDLLTESRIRLQRDREVRRRLRRKALRRLRTLVLGRARR